MHQAAFDYVASVIEEFGPGDSVIEIGSRDINGSIRGLFEGPNFEGSSSYIGLDLHEGAGVDWVGDSCDYVPDEPVDRVVCCEVLEHASEWRQIITIGLGWLKDGGLLIVTCAGPGRKEHSAIDGKHRLLDGEHYGNVSVQDMTTLFRALGLADFSVVQNGQDTQAFAVK